MSAHEDLSRAHDIRGGSDRSFGFTFTVVFGLLGLWPLVHGHPVRIWWLGAGAAVFIVTLVKASVLGPLNRLWTRFGAMLNRIVSPILSALVFYLAITPIAMLLRWRGKDPLRLRFDEKADSYWLVREPPGPEPATMVHQF
jgi:saxitoxin biosynthesis operon SxtJ-like protein